MTKILKELPNTVVNTKTKEGYDKLMEIYEEVGWKWGSGDSPTQVDHWGLYEEDTCIDVEDGFKRGGQEWHQKKGYTIISFDEFLKKEGIENVVCFGNVTGTFQYSLPETDAPDILLVPDDKMPTDSTALSTEALKDGERFAKKVASSEYSFPELEIAQLLKVAQSIKQNKMKKLTKTQKRVLNKDQQAMIKVGYKGDNLKLTAKGGEVLKQLIARDYEEKLAEEAKKELKEQLKVNKSNK